MPERIAIPEMTETTPNGKPCWIPGEVLAEVIRNQAKGRFQKEVAETLISQGYIIEYKPTGTTLKGKAKSYNTRYNTSTRHLMARIAEVLPGTLDILSDFVGPKNAFGYRLVI
jgi:hypothetical protein